MTHSNRWVLAGMCQAARMRYDTATESRMEVSEAWIRASNVKRKKHFESPDEMFERFKDRPPYTLFEPAALRDYCEFGLLPAADGDGCELACPPAIEASVYMTSRTNPGVYDSIRALEIPVMILRAEEASGDGGVMDFSSSPTWPALVHEFPNGREIYLPDHSHFLPMEASEWVAGVVLGRESWEVE